MTDWRLESWDGGRMTVEASAAGLLSRHGLDCVSAVMSFGGGEVAKSVLAERTTQRLHLADEHGIEQTLFLKRHSRPPRKEYWKAWVRLTRPILGAENEWLAILAFHAAGLRTMEPVAWGQDAGGSFLLTRGIEGCQSLAERFRELDSEADGTCRTTELRRYARLLGRVTRRMHAAGLHHQDYYLYHLLVPVQQPSDDVYIIDLGRARQLPRLNHRSRWVVKDLAQLMFAAGGATLSDQWRFLREYLGRSLQPSDRRWLRRIAAKSNRIRQHTRRHGL